jgi:predicted ferric reductase
VTVSVAGAVTSASNWYWYFDRATGMIALVLLTATIAVGVLGPLRVSTTAWPRFAIRTVHRDLALLSMLIIAVHIVTAVLDGYVHIPLSAAVLPFGSSYRPLWIALGAVSFDLLLAIVTTSLLRRQIGDRSWRLVHWFTYVSWPIAVAHGLGAGSDSGRLWALAITIGCCAMVGLAVLGRVRNAWPASPATPVTDRNRVSAKLPLSPRPRSR